MNYIEVQKMRKDASIGGALKSLISAPGKLKNGLATGNKQAVRDFLMRIGLSDRFANNVYQYQQGTPIAVIKKRRALQDVMKAKNKLWKRVADSSVDGVIPSNFATDYLNAMERVRDFNRRAGWGYPDSKDLIARYKNLTGKK